MVSANAPQPENDNLDTEVLLRCYLPWSANTAGIAENAKVSICVETLLRLLNKNNCLQKSKPLQTKAEDGIEARRKICSIRIGK